MQASSNKMIRAARILAWAGGVALSATAMAQTQPAATPPAAPTAQSPFWNAAGPHATPAVAATLVADTVKAVPQAAAIATTNKYEYVYASRRLSQATERAKLDRYESAEYQTALNEVREAYAALSAARESALSTRNDDDRAAAYQLRDRLSDQIARRATDRGDFPIET
jgi:hypothetical protein